MKTQVQRDLGLETEVIDGVPVQVGRDPRKISQDDLRALGFPALVCFASFEGALYRLLCG